MPTETVLKGKTLLVEDDPVATAFISSVLIDRGHNLLVASSGEEAWELYLRHAVALVITDWVLPGMSGPELCINIRKMEKARYTHILVITALDSLEEQQEALDAGADDYLTKPLDLHVLTLRLAVAENSLKLRIARVVNEESMKEIIAGMSRLSGSDFLTGFLNRHSFLESLKHETSRAKRTNSPLVLLVAHADNFSQINARLGIESADGLIRQAARMFSSSMRDHDLAGRLDGVTFGVILPHTEIQGGVVVARRIQAGLSSIELPQGDRPSLSVSVAVSLFRPMEDSVDSLMDRTYQGVKSPLAKGDGGSLVI